MDIIVQRLIQALFDLIQQNQSINQFIQGELIRKACNGSNYFIFSQHNLRIYLSKLNINSGSLSLLQKSLRLFGDIPQFPAFFKITGSSINFVSASVALRKEGHSDGS